MMLEEILIHFGCMIVAGFIMAGLLVLPSKIRKIYWKIKEVKSNNAERKLRRG